MVPLKAGLHKGIAQGLAPKRGRPSPGRISFRSTGARRPYFVRSLIGDTASNPIWTVSLAYTRPEFTVSVVFPPPPRSRAVCKSKFNRREDPINHGRQVHVPHVWLKLWKAVFHCQSPFAASLGVAREAILPHRLPIGRVLLARVGAGALISGHWVQFGSRPIQEREA